MSKREARDWEEEEDDLSTRKRLRRDDELGDEEPEEGGDVVRDVSAKREREDEDMLELERMLKVVRLEDTSLDEMADRVAARDLAAIEQEVVPNLGGEDLPRLERLVAQRLPRDKVVAHMEPVFRRLLHWRFRAEVDERRPYRLVANFERLHLSLIDAGRPVPPTYWQRAYAAANIYAKLALVALRHYTANHMYSPGMVFPSDRSLGTCGTRSERARRPLR
jgi:hypothetical protein